MKDATISLNALYDEFHGELSNGIIERTIEGKTEYYDLYVNNQLVCMDGETCIIIEENENNFVLSNSDGEQVITFTLTNEEMKVATFN